MNIVVNFDPSVNGAPAGFKAAVNDAVQFLDAEFASPVTITIDVGYGEVDGQALGSGALGESLTFLTGVTYSQLVNALPAGTLPAADPTKGGSFSISTAEAKALGILGASSSVDGFVGFSSTAAFTYDPNNRAVPGEYDFIGVVEHEITEVMGRISLLDSGGYSLMDLFRYSAPGVRSLTASQAAYFSIDGGQTNLDNFNSNPGGDLGDWAASADNDAFLAFSSAGVMNAFSSADVVLMDTLGYGSASPPQAAVVTAVLEQPSTGDLGVGKTVTITLRLSKPVTVAVAGGNPTLMLNDGGTAQYSSGSGSNALTFLYTVGSHDSDVASLAATSVVLNGATITDSSGIAATLSLVGLTQNGPQIDASIPAVTAVVEQPSTGHLVAGDTVMITLDLTEMVTVTGGSPALVLNDGAAAQYVSGSGSSALNFLYTVGANDHVGSLGATSVNLNGATIADAAGNAANLSVTSLSQNGPQIGTVQAQTIQDDYLAITRTVLSLADATTEANAINAGTTTETGYINSLLAQVADTTIPAVAVEASMYGAVGSSAEVTSLVTNFLPAQLAYAAMLGVDLTIFATEALGLAFATGNETGATTFATNFGPSNSNMPDTAAGDAAFAAAASSAIFGAQSNAILVNFISTHLSYWVNLYTAFGLPGNPQPSADQIDLAARGAAWGDAVGIALVDNAGPLPALVTNFLEDAAQGTAVYSASLASQPTAFPFQGATSLASAASHVQLTGVLAHTDHMAM